MGGKGTSLKRFVSSNSIQPSSMSKSRFGYQRATKPYLQATRVARGTLGR